MQHNSLTLRVTPSGRMFMRFLVALNTGDTERIADFIEQNYAARVLRDVDVDFIAQYYMDVYNQTGGLDIHKVYFTQEYHVIVITKSRNSGELYLDKMVVDDLPPYAIVEYLHGQPTEV